MVNGPLLPIVVRERNGAQRSTSSAGKRFGSWRWHNAKRPRSLFAQILGKFYFFNLRENLRHILFDYEEKRSCITNGAFKGAC
jgi:hypothetical protein